MDVKILSSNLGLYRKAKKLSMKKIAEESGLPYNIYRKLESGQGSYFSDNLDSIAVALDVSNSKLIRPLRELRHVRLLTNKKFNERNTLLLDAGHWIVGYECIEDLLDDHIPNQLEAIRKQLTNKNDRAKQLANVTRKAFGLKYNDQIYSLCGLLESEGIKMGEVKVDSFDFFGFSINENDGGPAIIVNTFPSISVEQRIFAAAHELGHLLLHKSDYEVDTVKEKKQNDIEANEFASQFLMPEADFQEIWDHTSGLALIDRVIKIKQMYRVSYKTILYRRTIESTGGVNYWSRFQNEVMEVFRKKILCDDEIESYAKGDFRGNYPESRRDHEPETLYSIDFLICRLHRLVRQAVESDKINLSRGAEILNLSYEGMCELARSWYPPYRNKELL